MKSRPVRRPVARKPRVRVVEPVRPAGVEVKITPAKGRPMLTWVGKRPLSHVTAFPAQHIETFDPAGMLIRPPARAEFWKDWPAFYPKGGLLFHGDNKEVLAHLLANGFRGRVHLIYIDPPFDSGADYVRKISLRGPRGTAKLDGEGYTLGEQIQYSDIWANDNYLQFMYERLLLLKELLSDEGSIYLHSDWHRSHHLRAVMDEVFGAESFRSEIVWQRVSAHANIVDSYGNVHDSILYYGKSDRFTWNTLYISYSEEHLRSSYRNVEEGTGRRYALRDITAPIVRASKGQLYAWKGILPPANRCWVFSKDRMEQFEREGRLVYSSKGYPRLKVYLDEMKGVPLQTIWTDVLPLQAQSSERTEFPTQKSEELLERILKVSSSPGDIVLDCFIGSGTIAAVAERFGRRWIGCDINKGAIQTTGKRLQTVILEQMEASSQGKIIETEGGSPNGPPLAQLAFTVWRVNDYDLTIQHNEAVNLACEHIGVQRTRTDTYFDAAMNSTSFPKSTLGKPNSSLSTDARYPPSMKTALCRGTDASPLLGLETQIRRPPRGPPYLSRRACGTAGGI